MKRLLNWCLGFALAFILGSAVYVGAQNITKGLQLSQDPTGSFGVDSSNNVYFPGHIFSVGLTPTLTQGLFSSTVVGTDTAGTITGVNQTASAGGLVFRSAFLATPNCVAVPNGTTTTSPIAYTPQLTGIDFTTWSGAVKVTYWCSGQK